MGHPVHEPIGRPERAARPHNRHRGSFLHEPLDPSARPDRVPAPWTAHQWRQLAPFRTACKARVFVAPDGHRKVVCKDYSYGLRHSAFRWTRRMALRNELRALRRLSGLSGVPDLLGAWDTGFVMEWVPGRRLGDLQRGSVPAAVFDALQHLVAAIHARGVLIGDLHRRNIMVRADLSVSLLDFEAALVLDAGIGRLAGSYLRRLPVCSVDRTQSEKQP